MPELTKAKLFTLDANGNPSPAEGFDVQFNPASLKLTLQNQVEGGRNRGRQRQQFNGHSSSQLAFDLHFDTSDEGVTENPRSVREKTAELEKFVMPRLRSPGSSQRITPPRVRFEWGGLRVDGVIKSLAIDFELFAHNGFPLRAKMGVSIEEQDPRYEILQSRSGAASPDPAAGGGGATSAAPGSAGGGPTNRTATALGGESLADFARRNGLAPEAWRGLAAGVEGTLSLSAGLAIDFDASIDLAAGLGVSVGFAASAGTSIEATLGLDAGAGAGFSLSAAGGVSAAINTVESARVDASAREARAAFEAPGAALPGAPHLPRVDAPRPDPRAKSFGAAIPLRPLRVRGTGDDAQRTMGAVPTRGGGAVPTTWEPGLAPWVALREVDDGSVHRAQSAKGQKRRCTCGARCRCRGGLGGTPCP
jgi:hypothetical protein